MNNAGQSETLAPAAGIVLKSKQGLLQTSADCEGDKVLGSES